MQICVLSAESDKTSKYQANSSIVCFCFGQSVIVIDINKCFPEKLQNKATLATVTNNYDFKTNASSFYII